MRAIQADAAGRWPSLPSVSVAILDTDRLPLPISTGAGSVSLDLVRPDEDARLQTCLAHSIAIHHRPERARTLVSSIVASNSGFFAGVTTRTTLFASSVASYSIHLDSRDPERDRLCREQAPT